MKRILFVNACVREESRTKRLAEHLLSRLDGTVETVTLEELNFPLADQRFLRQRDALAAQGAFADPLFALARQFAAADIIVVAAPYWDLSFPAMLKQYFEQINAVGVTFAYSPEGIPVSLCRAKSLYYVTTAGGPIVSDAFGFGYVRALAEGFYQIPEIRLIQAEGLDMVGADVEALLRQAEAEIGRLPEASR